MSSIKAPLLLEFKWYEYLVSYFIYVCLGLSSELKLFARKTRLWLLILSFVTRTWCLGLRREEVRRGRATGNFLNFMLDSFDILVFFFSGVELIRLRGEVVVVVGGLLRVVIA